jgi:hypothetical protein
VVAFALSQKSTGDGTSIYFDSKENLTTAHGPQLFVDLSQKGDKGDKGDPGAPGISIKGDKGDKGDPGAAGVVTNISVFSGAADTADVKNPYEGGDLSYHFVSTLAQTGQLKAGDKVLVTFHVALEYANDGAANYPIRLNIGQITSGGGIATLAADQEITRPNHATGSCSRSAIFAAPADGNYTLGAVLRLADPQSSGVRSDISDVTLTFFQ